MKKSILLLVLLVAGTGASAKQKKQLIQRVYDHEGRVTYSMHIPANTTTYSFSGQSGWCEVGETRVECSSESLANLKVILEDGSAEYAHTPLERPWIDPIHDLEFDLIANGDRAGDRRLFKYRVMQPNEKLYRLTGGRGGFCIADDKGQAAEACYKFAAK